MCAFAFRRLASLQKRRELRAAGLDVRLRPKKSRRRGVDYSADIPFEKKPAPGFYDTSEEKHATILPNFKRLRRHDLDEKRRKHEEERERRKDKERQKKRKEMDLPGAVSQISKLNSAEPVRKRSKLVLPSPQISDIELEEVVKLGQASEQAHISAIEDGMSAASQSLLADYSITPASGMSLRTPRTPAANDSLLQEAQNLITLTQAETPLAGGVNEPLHETSFEGVTPRRHQIETFRTPERGGATPRTPVRDKLSINPDEALLDDSEEALKQQEQEIMMQLREELAGLPTPKNDFEIVMPEMPTEDKPSNRRFVPDASDLDAAAQAKVNAEGVVAIGVRSCASLLKLISIIGCSRNTRIAPHQKHWLHATHVSKSLATTNAKADVAQLSSARYAYSCEKD
ncbi:cell division cycle 5-related protein-like [Corticium candelabrum]|uniref:cell division cycle 5-related protein-like n=1 Tax=Corticium candelabrum TaxID=121492 RepID=UPI002E2577A1|nr:cell division cycle 5-related protein-like [Corticium candelabrum]